MGKHLHGVVWGNGTRVSNHLSGWVDDTFTLWPHGTAALDEFLNHLTPSDPPSTSQWKLNQIVNEYSSGYYLFTSRHQIWAEHLDWIKPKTNPSCIHDRSSLPCFPLLSSVNFHALTWGPSYHSQNIVIKVLYQILHDCRKKVQYLPSILLMNPYTISILTGKMVRQISQSFPSTYFCTVFLGLFISLRSFNTSFEGDCKVISLVQT